MSHDLFQLAGIAAGKVRNIGTILQPHVPKALGI